MVRDDLFITVPSFFRCPISLDVMTSPVSLYTGVTYDRSSIQRWLDNGNNTCPVTMQVLDTKEFVPNRNLHRLIQIWSDSVHKRLSAAATSKEQVLDAFRDLNTQPSNRFDSLTKILGFAQQSEENREFLVKMDNFVPTLVGFLQNVDAGISESVPFLGQVVQALDLVLSKIENREPLRISTSKCHNNCLDSLLLVLQQGSSDSRMGSARVLKFMAMDTESKLLIAEKEGLISELLNLITPDKDPALMGAALSCLVAISMPKRSRDKLVQYGAVKALSKLLLESNLNAFITEMVLKLLETLSSIKEGRSDICEEPSCLPAILSKVLKVSSIATEHAVKTLWSVCCQFRDEKAQEAVAKANGLTKILLLMQSNCSPAVRQMSANLLKIFQANSKSCLSCYDTKTTHIRPF